MVETGKFSGRIRARVCGICLIDNKILLARHSGLGESGTLWLPPGGGVEFGESLESALVREFDEEAGLNIDVDRFLFIHEFLGGTLHALEFFFSVTKISGEMTLGADPELPKSNQMLVELRLFDSDELKAIPPGQKHQIFSKVTHFEDLFALKGHFKTENTIK